MNTDFIKIYEELDQLYETNNKITGRFDRPIARGGNWFGIDTKYSEDELARMEQEKAEEAKRKAEREKKQLLDRHLELASKVTTKDEAHQFNRRHEPKVNRNNFLPLIDPETLELVYDEEGKQSCLDQMRAWVDNNLKTAAEERAARDATNYTWHCRLGKTNQMLATQYFPKDANQEECIQTMKQLGKDALNKLAREARAWGGTFDCDGRIIITYVPDPAHKHREETVKVIQLTKKTKA